MEEQFLGRQKPPLPGKPKKTEVPVRFKNTPLETSKLVKKKAGMDEFMSLRAQADMMELTKRLLENDLNPRIPRKERFELLEQEAREREDVEKAKKIINDQKKWQEQVILKLDLVPKQFDYYDKLAVRPGFDFFQAIINATTELKIQIPETLYYNYATHLIYTEKGKVVVKKDPKREDFLSKVEAECPYDIVKNWQEPCCLLKSTTTHPCYTKIKLMNWKKTYELMEKGPSNRTMVQRYQRSFGDRMAVYRAICFNKDQVGESKGKIANICYAMTNRLQYRVLQAQEDDVAKLAALQSQSEETEEFKRKFEQRYVTCPFEVGSFDIFTYSGKTMDMLEKEVYKLFDFFKKEYLLEFQQLVTDWVRDVKGNYWLVGIKSFNLTDENYIQRALKPGMNDAAMKAILRHGKVERVKCVCCKGLFKPLDIEQTTLNFMEFLELVEVDIIRDSIWATEEIKRNVNGDKVPFCQICFQVQMREKEFNDMKGQLAKSQYVPFISDYEKAEEEKRQLRKNPMLKNKVLQWRFMMIFEKFCDVDLQILATNGQPVFLQYKIANYITKFQVVGQKESVKYVFEKRDKVFNNLDESMQESVDGELSQKEEEEEDIDLTEEEKAQRALERERKGIGKEKVKVVKVFKSRLHFFFTEKIGNARTFFTNQEIEIRVTRGSEWSKYIAQGKAPLLNFFTSHPFQRNSSTQYQRHLILFTDDLKKLDLLLTVGMALDYEQDLSSFSEVALKKHMGAIYFPPEHYFSQNFALQTLPHEWVAIMKEESQAALVSKEKGQRPLSKKVHKIPTHGPDGKRYTKEQRAKMLKFAHVEGKLLEPTAANRLAGMLTVPNTNKKRKSKSPAKNKDATGSDNSAQEITATGIILTGIEKDEEKIHAKLSIADQILAKRKLKRKGQVMPSQKAVFLKNKKSWANKVYKTDGKDKFEEVSVKSEEDQSKQPKQKMIGLENVIEKQDQKHSRSLGLIKTHKTSKQAEVSQKEIEVTRAEDQYNKELFDLESIIKIRQQNIEALNPQIKTQQKIMEQKNALLKMEKTLKMIDKKESKQKKLYNIKNQKYLTQQEELKLKMERDAQESRQKLEAQMAKIKEKEHQILRNMDKSLHNLNIIALEK